MKLPILTEVAGIEIVFYPHVAQPDLGVGVTHLYGGFPFPVADFPSESHFRNGNAVGERFLLRGGVEGSVYQDSSGGGELEFRLLLGVAYTRKRQQEDGGCKVFEGMLHGWNLEVLG